MLVRNLVPWSGLDFSFAPGDELDLPDGVAQARIDAGLAEPVAPDPAPPEAPAPRASFARLASGGSAPGADRRGRRP